MNLRTTGILTAAVAGALAAGACTSMNNENALDQTKAASLPAKSAPSTLPDKGGPVHPNTPPLAETKAAAMVYGAAPSTLPQGRRMTDQQIRVAFRLSSNAGSGRRIVHRRHASGGFARPRSGGLAGRLPGRQQPSAAPPQQ